MTENIQCPKCSKVQTATVTHEGDLPLPSFVHTCTDCGYHITESEWQAAGANHNLPPAMVEAATKAVVAYTANLNACSLQLTEDFYGEMIEAALKAAGVAALLARIAELEAALTLAIPRSVQFCNEVDEQKAKDIALEIERLNLVMQNAPKGAGGE